MIRYLFLGLLLLSVCGCHANDHLEQVTDLGGKGWTLWLDNTAQWQNDTLYLPSDVNLSRLPVNAPTGGWDSLTSPEAISISLPATVSEYVADGKCDDEYLGVSWFTKTVNIPSQWTGKHVRIRIEKARMRTEVYVNQRLAGYDLVAETYYECDITPFLQAGQPNQIALRITNPGGSGNGVPNKNWARGWNDFPFVYWGKYKFPASKGFTGIGGDVTLIVTDRIYLSEVFVKNLLPANSRTVNVISTVVNTTGSLSQAAFMAEIFSSSDNQLLHTEKWTAQVPSGSSIVSSPVFSVPNAQLWELQAPALYICKVSFTSSRQINGAKQQRFGFRTVQVKEVDAKDNLYVNGKRIRFRSAIDWGFYGQGGNYATPEMAQKNIIHAKQIGLNCLNFHRHIGEPLVMDRADEMGLYLYEEPGGFHFKDAFYNMSNEPFCISVMMEKIRRMVIRDRNHPSLIWFNLANESGQWNKHRQEALNLIRDLDGTRMMTNSSSYKGGNTEMGTFQDRHIRPYETAIRTDYIDNHTVANGRRFRESELTSHQLNRDDVVQVYGEVRDYTGPSNWYLTAEMQKPHSDGRTGYSRNVYLPLHDAIQKIYYACQLDKIGSRCIKSPADVSVQAGRGLMYTNGRIGQVIMSNDSVDGFAINGWSNGPQLPLKWDSAMVDEGRNLKGPAQDMAYWTRDKQIAIFRTNGKYFQPGQTAEFNVFLINENKIPSGNYALHLTVTDGQGKRTDYRNVIDVKVIGGDTYSQKIGTINVPMKDSYHGGYITVTGKLLKGDSLIADGKEQVLLQNRPSFAPQLSNLKGAVVDWPAAKTALADAGLNAPEFAIDTDKLDFVVVGKIKKTDTTASSPDNHQPDAGGKEPSALGQSDIASITDNLLRRVANDGTTLIVAFDQLWADTFYEKGLLSQPVSQWGGVQTAHWSGNGWGYIDYFIGDQAVPSKSIIGTKSWEVPSDPNGFYPFESKNVKGAYGLYFARPDLNKDLADQPALLVLIGTLDYGKGKILLCSGYHVDQNNAFTDLLFYNMITTSFSKHW